MKIFFLLSLVFASCAPVSAPPPLLCQKNSDSQGSEVEFTCQNSQLKFVALCDLSQDPLEFGSASLDIRQGRWVQYGENEGLAFSKGDGSGFIVCRKLIHGAN
jgi:hypothetical protein